MYALPVVNEIHTSDLIAECPHQRMLLHQGGGAGEYTGALYKGQVGHRALKLLHDEGNFSAKEGEMGVVVADAACHVQELAVQECRPLSKSVRDHLDDYHGELVPILKEYCERMGPQFEAGEVVGTELPVEYTTTLPGCGEVTFSSHIDLLWRDRNNQLVIGDWKFQEEQPSMEYLGRNLQFAFYWLCVAYGKVCVDPLFDEWVELHEYAECAWFDMWRFKPYVRVVYNKDKTVKAKKGDKRDERDIVRRWSVDPEREDEIRHDLAMRIALMRQGIWPKHPEKLRCNLCECKSSCRSYHK